MLEIATGRARRTSEGTTWRELLQVRTLALGGLSLPGLLAARARAADSAAEKDTSIVLLFLTGGPSQIETIDPKMTAPAEYHSVCGQVASTIPGVAFGGTFEKLAALADRMAIVRSFTHENSDHTRAVEKVMRGSNPIHQASMGAMGHGCA